LTFWPLLFQTSLLSAILGELSGVGGEVVVGGSVGLCPQAPAIFPGTLRSNILFGSAWRAEWYGTVVSACALDKDFAGFPLGDLSLVGERGLRLSGGQKARVSLARAVYADADLLLLDDPLSAVDARTGRRIFEECIQGLLGSKTVLLLSHHAHFLTSATLLLTMRDGRLERSSSFQELGGGVEVESEEAGSAGGLSLSDLESDPEDDAALELKSKCST
jgi:ABC-type transport system involved in cytochrome bd biosynthesis fused ATPase/permease subunit